MFIFSQKYSCVRRTFSLVLAVSIFVVASALAQTATKKYGVELVVSQGKKSVETDSFLDFDTKGIQIEPEKKSFKSSGKTFTYAEIKSADYSYSKKPMLSGGGAVATTILLGVFVLPFLFMKKKNHWITVQTEKEFAVLKLDDSNYRQIMAEFTTHGVKVNTVEEEKKGGKTTAE